MSTQEIKHTFFMLVKTTHAWLALDPPARFAYLGDKIEPILQRAPQVKLRFFDAEAFNARITDVVMWETTDLAAYLAIVESLREIEFWDRYFEVVEIVPAIENAYATHYNATPLGSSRRDGLALAQDT